MQLGISFHWKTFSDIEICSLTVCKCKALDYKNRSIRVGSFLGYARMCVSTELKISSFQNSDNLWVTEVWKIWVLFLFVFCTINKFQFFDNEQYNYLQKLLFQLKNIIFIKENFHY